MQCSLLQYKSESRWWVQSELCFIASKRKVVENSGPLIVTYRSCKNRVGFDSFWAGNVIWNAAVLIPTVCKPCYLGETLTLKLTLTPTPCLSSLRRIKWECEGTQNCKAAWQWIVQSKTMIVVPVYRNEKNWDNLLSNLTNACHVISYYENYF